MAEIWQILDIILLYMTRGKFDEIKKSNFDILPRELT